MIKRGILILIIIIPLWFFGFLTPRNYSFSYECLKAKNELKAHFGINKTEFYRLVELVKKAPPINFSLYGKDSIDISFQDSSIAFVDIFIDSVYHVESGNEREYFVDKKDCLLIVETDTLEVCNRNWQVNFYGNYKDKRIEGLLSYYGWTLSEFHEITEIVKSLNCYSFSCGNGDFGLGYKIVSYHDDGRLHCFGHQNGYFDYLYTSTPQRFEWQRSLKDLENDFYGIEHWRFSF